MDTGTPTPARTMRSFHDEAGRLWDVTVGRASYGAHVLIFAQRGGREIRQTPMDANSALDAQNELGDMAEDDLRVRLGRAEEWH